MSGRPRPSRRRPPDSYEHRPGRPLDVEGPEVLIVCPGRNHLGLPVFAEVTRYDQYRVQGRVVNDRDFIVRRERAHFYVKLDRDYARFELPGDLHRTAPPRPPVRNPVHAYDGMEIPGVAFSAGEWSVVDVSISDGRVSGTIKREPRSRFDMQRSLGKFNVAARRRGFFLRLPGVRLKFFKWPWPPEDGPPPAGAPPVRPFPQATSRSSLADLVRSLKKEQQP